MRADHANTRSRPFGHYGGSSSARPAPGRGNITLGNRARDTRRNRDAHGFVGGQRDQQVARSLAERITIDRGGRGGRRGRGEGRLRAEGAARREDRGLGHAYPQFDRITGTINSGMGRLGTQAAGHNVTTNPTNSTAHTSGSGTFSNAAPFVAPQQHQVASETDAQEPVFPFDPLFDEPVRSQVSRAPAPMRASTHTQGARSAVGIRKPKPARVAKKPGHFIENKKLRGILLGIKPRQPKRHDAMLLRVAQTTNSLQGHELTCASPAHSNVDGYGGDDGDEE